MIGVQPRLERSDSQQLWAVGAILALAVPLGLIALATTKTPLTLVVGGLVALVLLGVTAWRPTVGLLFLVVAVPLTAGLGRGTILPLARPSEALMAVVIVGTLVHEIPIRRRLGYSGLDVAVLAFAVGGSVVPWAVLFLDRQAFGTDTWTAVLAPMQYLVIFLLFSRVQMSGRTLKLLFGLQLAVGTLLAIIGLAQLAALPGVREFIAATYPYGGGGINICQYGVCRPTSLLEHWSSYGAYALLTYTIALALVSTPGSGFSSRWLPLVIGANAVAVFASQTQAAIIGLALATLLVFAHRRHVPRQLLIAFLALVIGVGLFWPQIQARVEQQLVGQGSGGLATPESLQTRDRYWNEFFLPVVTDHIWVGTGTLVPTDVPEPLVMFVDNEYLRMALRAGVIGVALLLTMLVSISVAGWRQRHNPEPLAQAVGAMAVSFAVVLAVMGWTAEYLTYAGVAQLFWMVAGLLGATMLPIAATRRLTAVQAAPTLALAEEPVVDGAHALAAVAVPEEEAEPLMPGPESEPIAETSRALPVVEPDLEQVSIPLSSVDEDEEDIVFHALPAMLAPGQAAVAVAAEPAQEAPAEPRAEKLENASDQFQLQLGWGAGGPAAGHRSGAAPWQAPSWSGTGPSDPTPVP
ncbi:MAG TPA: O-antigen ligase family protein [Candidatus Dormibacteraeota bacterium]|nr:O-antigen ligase family protein [Candidatus Dormibacteraeota bacterium]